MIKITRSNEYIRSEKGGEWFDEFLHSLAKEKDDSVGEIIDAIQHKKNKSVQGVVNEYRKMVGLDAFADTEKTNDMTVNASYPLSIRHGSAVSEIEQDFNLKEDVRSLCEHSGGTKNTHAIINFLRDKLGKELVSYSDNDLIKYIEDIKEMYKDNIEEPHGHVGKVGTDVEDHPEDNAADYITHGKGS